MSALDELIAGLEAGDVDRALGSLQDDTVLRVAVHAQPFVGRETIGFIFNELFSGIFTDLHVREVLSDGLRRVAVFGVGVIDYPEPAEGLILITVDEQDELREVTVFLRPLDALQSLADEMGRRLGGPRPQ
ncbi:MAG: hypothetical protein ACR2JF_02290 [Iamia sp.]